MTDSLGEVVELEEITPWVEARRDEKLKTFPKLPDLLDAIARKAAEAIKETEQTSAAANKGLEALGKK